MVLYLTGYVCLTMKTQYPYQNLSLTNIKGEKWKDIPGFEGYYKVSSFGRIKSLLRDRPSIWTKPITIQERIRKSKLTINYNRTINAPLYTLLITLNRDGHKFHYSVGRLVYTAFVEPIDLKNRNILISYKDKDGRNLHYKNLIKSNISELKLESFANKRSTSNLSILSKPVTQFNAKGEPMDHYPSMYAAAKKTDLLLSAIAEAAHGKTQIYGGYFWRFGTIRKKLDLQSLRKSSVNDPLIHTALKEKLGIKSVNKKNIRPYLNLSLTSLKGERWKDMPGYEELYMISSMGKVKALAGISGGKNKKFREEHIKRLTATDFRTDNSGKQLPGTLYVTLCKRPQRKRPISVARWVYYLFVKKFDIKNSNLRVYYTDNNSLNLHYKNLELHPAGWSIIKNHYCPTKNSIKSSITLS